MPWMFPEINRMAVFDKAKYGSLGAFLGNEGGMTNPCKFIPVGTYTMTEGVTLVNDVHHYIMGGSPPLYRANGQSYGGGYDLNGSASGFTNIVFTGTADNLEMDWAPTILYANVVTMRDLTITKDVNPVTVAVGLVGFTRVSEATFENCSFLDKYEYSPGRAIHITGSQAVSMRNIHVEGFGGTSTGAYDTCSVYLRLNKCNNIENITFRKGDIADPFIFIQDCPYTNIKNLVGNDFGDSTNPSNLIRITASANTTSAVSIDGLHLYYTTFPSTQYGFFDVRATNCTIDVRNVFFKFDDFATCESPNNWGKVHLHGSVAGIATFYDTPYGAVTNFADNTYRIISPKPPTGASTVNASITYTCSIRPVELEVKGGTGVAVTVDGVARTYNSAGSYYRVNVGDTIAFGAFSVAPTVSAYFIRD